MSRFNANGISGRVFWVGVLLAMAVGFGLRAYKIWENEFWTDELMAIRTSHTIEGVQKHCFSRFTSPPFRYLLTWFFLNYPHEERLVRIPSLLSGCLAIMVAALLARNWFGSPAGFWSAWAVALNPWMIVYSQDGRMHIVAMFFYLSALWLALHPTWGSRRGYLLLGGVCLAFSSAITYAAVIVCFGGLLVVLWEFYRNSGKQFRSNTLAFSTPWAVWMFSWLSLLWIVTSAAWTQDVSQIEMAPPRQEITIGADSTPPSNPPPRRMPLLDPYFYREALADTWQDRPLKFLVILGFIVFISVKGIPGCPSRTSRILLFAIPIAVILFLQPQQFYRRYLLSLLPFPLIGIGILGAFMSGRVLGKVAFAILLVGLSIQPVAWVINHPPQAWNATGDYLKDHLEHGDQLLMGTHQAEYAASWYMVGKVPTWKIVYNGMFLNRFVDIPKEKGTCWFVQWFGMPPRFEHEFLKIYDKAAVFPGRFGTITIYREKAPEKESLPL